MEYEDYFTRFPQAYARIVESLDRVETLSRFLRGHLRGANSVLSIGCGDARVEQFLAREMGFSLGLIEPSESYLDGAVRAAEELDLNLSEVHRGPFQTYDSKRQYDVVLSVYSWFAFEFDREMLEKALACCASGGKLIICLQGESAPSTQISALSRASGINLTSEKMSAWARAEGFEHELDVYHGLVRADAFLQNQEFTTTGRDWVSFLLATPWDEVSPELRAQTLTIVRESVVEGEIDLESPCLIFGPGSRTESSLP